MEDNNGERWRETGVQFGSQELAEEEIRRVLESYSNI